jgi:hypothetical protein
MSDLQLVNELLNDRAYHIEFNGHLSNHVKHAVVALAGLGAPPQRIKAYYDTYAKLTPYGYGLEPPKPSKHAISAATWDQHLGKRTSYSAYCEFLDQQERELGLDELLRRYLVPLLPGWVGAFTHAAIHLGWALDVNHRWMIIEGLAYMAFAHVSCHPERAIAVPGGRHAGEQAVDSLLRIAGAWDADRDALRAWVAGLLADTTSGAAAAIHPELMRSGLQYRIARLLGAGHPLIYETPAWIHAQELSASWEQLYHVVTLLYLAHPGDFVLLHLITSLYAMEQIAARLPADQRRYVVQCFWIGMLCIVFSSGDFPPREKLAALHATYRDALDGPTQPAVVKDWDQIVARAIAEEEEHNPKMVYVLQRVWRRTGGRTVYRVAAAQFTTTPELPKSFEEPPNE